MKVVHLLPALEQGGVETVVCDLVKALGRNVGIWKYGNGGIDELGNGEKREIEKWESVVVSKGGRLVGRIEAAGGRHIALDLKSKNPLTYFQRAWKLRRILRVEKPDLVCVHSRVPAWLFVWANRKLGLKWISYAHGANSVSRYSAVMTKGDLIVTPSRFLADYLKSNYGTPESKIRVIPNSVDAARFDPENLDQAFIAEKRREWGIREGDRVIMAIGRITPVKGLDGLIKEVLSRTSGQETASTLKLVIVGEADKHHQKYFEGLKALAADLSRLQTNKRTIEQSVNSPVVFAGPQEKIPECISIADEVVSANVTKPETFGLSVIEAYAMNRPVRAKRFGGVAEVMEAVERAGKPTLREAVVELYGPERQAERTLAAYRELLG